MSIQFQAYTLTGVETEFTFDFRVYDVDLLDVILDGVPGTPFTADGIGTGASQITVRVPSAAGVTGVNKLRIEYAIGDTEKLTHFAASGAMTPAAIEAEFEQIYSRANTLDDQALQNAGTGTPFDADGERITDLAPGEDPTDGVNKAQLDAEASARVAGDAVNAAAAAAAQADADAAKATADDVTAEVVAARNEPTYDTLDERLDAISAANGSGSGLPTMTGQVGKLLSTDGLIPIWTPSVDRLMPVGTIGQFPSYGVDGAPIAVSGRIAPVVGALDRGKLVAYNAEGSLIATDTMDLLQLNHRQPFDGPIWKTEALVPDFEGRIFWVTAVNGHAKHFDLANSRLNAYPAADQGVFDEARPVILTAVGFGLGGSGLFIIYHSAPTWTDGAHIPLTRQFITGLSSTGKSAIQAKSGSDPISAVPTISVGMNVQNDGTGPLALAERGIEEFGGTEYNFTLESGVPVTTTTWAVVKYNTGLYLIFPPGYPTVTARDYKAVGVLNAGQDGGSSPNERRIFLSALHSASDQASAWIVKTLLINSLTPRDLPFSFWAMR